MSNELIDSRVDNSIRQVQLPAQFREHLLGINQVL